MSQGFFSFYSTCAHCAGAGEVIEKPCPQCRGGGRIKQEHKINVKIPAGIHNGTSMRVQGEGEAGRNGGRSGDLFVDITVAAHELFSRHEDDLYIDFPLSMFQAIMGAEIKVPTMEGPVLMKIPEGTQTGKLFRLKNKGMPNLQGYARGDQLVRVTVEIPVNLTSRQKELLSEFAKEGGEKINPVSSSFMHKIKRLFGS